MKKWLVTTLALVMTASLASGCGGNNGSTGKESGTASKPGSSDVKKTELTFWGIGAVRGRSNLRPWLMPLINRRIRFM